MKVIEGEFDIIYKNFESGDLDMILCEKPVFELGTKIRLFKLVESTFYVVCSPDFAWAQENFPKSLSQIPFMNYTNRTSIHGQILEFFFKNEICPQIIGEVDDVNIIRRFTVKGHCFSILPNSVITESIKTGRLIALSKVRDIKVSIYAILKNLPKNDKIFGLLEGIC